MTFDELLLRYRAARPFLAAGSFQQLEISARSFARHYELVTGRPAATERLDPSTVARWLGSLNHGGRSVETIRRKRTALLTLWRFAAAEGLAPAPGIVPAPRPCRRLPVAWTLAEMRGLVHAAGSMEGWVQGVPLGPLMQAMLLIEWDTAVRLGTLLALEWSQLDLDGCLLTIPARQLKGQPGDKIIRLHPETVTAVLATLPPKRIKLFPLSRRSAWSNLKSLLTSAGLATDRRHLFHCLRRSAESHAAALTTIEYAAAAVGHSPAVARASYISPLICRGPALVDILPRLE